MNFESDLSRSKLITCDALRVFFLLLLLKRFSLIFGPLVKTLSRRSHLFILESDMDLNLPNCQINNNKILAYKFFFARLF